ncbi:M4 family metallopeptidase [Archangium lansingense]|uniref:M4 family metallopeptidase n=1 Tax=Archangium lansingense TaxID=2995310 RepID=UPI003B79BC83
MKIQKNDFSRTAVTRSPEAKPAVAAEVKGNKTTRPTGFDTASSFEPQTKAPVDLTGAQRALPKTGPVAINSAVSQAAIQKTVDFLQQQSPAASARSLMGGSGVNASDFAPRSVERDDLGMTHVRMDRMSEGTRVFGEQVVGHISSDGKMDSVTGDVATIPAGLGSEPTKLSADQALAVAQQDFAGKTDRQPTSERVIFKGDDGQYRSAYHVQLSNTTDIGEGKEPRRMNYLVDANSGELLEKYNQMGGFDHVHTSGAKTPGSAPVATTDNPTTTATNDTTQYSGQVELNSTKNADGTYTLEDKTRGQGVVTRDALNRDPNTGSTKNAPITDNNDIWGEATDSARNKDAVDAQYGAQTTYDFFKDVLGRDSIDGQGEKLISDVHVGTNFANAFWDGEKMNYGDGDGQTFGSLTTLDIAGHEISHGLTERTAGLQYRNESGALNEAISDIMGTGVEWYASQKNEAVKFDWTVGEDTFTPNNGDPTDGLRDMSDPTSDGQSPDHYSKRYKGTQDNGGVHINSGIPNNAFYLLSEGGKNGTSGTEVKDGIGIEKSLKVYSRALSFYMTPTTNFAQAREATFKAAQDLYGKDSAEAKKVLESWSAVGVG